MAAIAGAFLPDISTYVADMASAAGVPEEHDQHLCMLPDHFRARFVLLRGCGEHTKQTGVTDVTSAEDTGAGDTGAEDTGAGDTGVEVPGHRVAAERAKTAYRPRCAFRNVRLFCRSRASAATDRLSGIGSYGLVIRRRRKAARNATGKRDRWVYVADGPSITLRPRCGPVATMAADPARRPETRSTGYRQRCRDREGRAEYVVAAVRQ
jgi:hypothetical protein